MINAHKKVDHGNWIRSLAWGLLIGLSFVMVLFVLDRSVGLFCRKKPYLPRTIRLRELPPNTDVIKKVPDDVLGRSDSLYKKSYRLRTDAGGFLEPSLPHSDPDLTIVFLGGSATECMYLDQENRFPGLVGKIIEGGCGIKVNSINSGVSGNHTLPAIDLLINKIPPFGPDIAVMHASLNDLVVLLATGSYWNESPSGSLLVTPSPFCGQEILLWVRYWLYPNLSDLVLSIPAMSIKAATP